MNTFDCELIPAGYSDEDWDELTHAQRMIALQNAAEEARNIFELVAIRDELLYYSTIRNSIASLMTRCGILEPMNEN